MSMRSVDVERELRRRRSRRRAAVGSAAAAIAVSLTVVPSATAAGTCRWPRTGLHLTAPSGNGSDVIVFEMTTSGLAALDANIGGVLVLTINADAIRTGDTSNTAEITVNGATGETSVVDPDEFFSGARIMKEAQNRGATSNVPLAGAQFDVYVADASVTFCPAEPAADAERVLSLFEVAGADSSVTVVNEQIGSAQGDLPSLPLTGGSGTALLLGAGAALVALGVGAYFLLAARRRQQEAGEAAGVSSL